MGEVVSMSNTQKATSPILFEKYRVLSSSSSLINQLVYASYCRVSFLGSMKIPFNFGRGKKKQVSAPQEKVNPSNFTSKEHQHPIPPPEHPKQYRAIGLFYGRYKPEENKQNRGFLFLEDNQVIDAVLLGKIMCIAEKHIDLEKKHLWVVYPRQQKDSDKFQVQITGIWEPETLKINSLNKFIPTENLIAKSGQFSIRGEVIYYNPEEERIIVKIIQSSSPKKATSNFLKLELKGNCENNILGHFVDFEVNYNNNILVINKARDLGFLAVKYVNK
jgi:hypothetical protein